MRRAAPGPQLGGGRLRVDAGRAIAKLREYQLADKSAWVLEAIRAAVAAKATRIALSGDANDIWLEWHGEPWPDEVLPRLLDELVSPETPSERHHVRLLAAAINSALGLEPAYIDVTAIHGAIAKRVRYTPEILVEAPDELGTSALRHVAVDTVPPPDGAQPGMRVHLRRRLGDWRIFSEPPELGLARDACRDISVPLDVAGELAHRDTSRDVVRLPLGEGLDGFIAITEPERATTSAMLQVAERGVVLAEYALELVGGKQRGLVPIRVFVDAARLPTNASRSQVRRDVHPISSAEKRAHDLSPHLIAQLAAAVSAGSERARASALTLIAALVVGSRWHVEAPSIRGPLRELAALPLVKNAVGQPRALTAHWRAEVHTGKQPFPLELAAWLDSVLWAPPGDPAVLLLRGVQVDTRGTRRLARWARKQLRAQLRFYAHAKREIRVLASATPFIRAPLGCAVDSSAVPDDMFDGLSGEVCVYTTGDSGALVILFEGRELERIEFDSPIAFDIVIDSARVTPDDRYRGAKRDAEYKRIERAMRGGLVRALEAHASGGPRHLVGDEALVEAHVLRQGFGVISELGLAVRGPLTSAQIFERADATWAALDELAKLPAIGVAQPGQEVAAVRDRVIVVLDNAERATLAQLVRGRLVPYRGLRVDPVLMVQRLGEQGEGALVVREPGMIAALTPAWQAELRLLHTGVELEQRAYGARWLRCVIAIDSDDIVPDARWTGVADDAGLRERDYATWELSLVRAIAAALAGEPPRELVLAGPIAIDGKLGMALCKALGDHDPGALLGSELVAKLRGAPIVRVLGIAERVSFDDVAAMFYGAIPYIAEDTAPIAGFTPLIATAGMAKALGRLVDRDVIHGGPELEQRRLQALRELRITALRGLPQQAIEVPADEHVSIATAVCRGVVRLGAGPFAIRVLVEGRPFAVLHPADHALRLSAAVDVGIDALDEACDKLKPTFERDIAITVRAAAPALLAEIATRRPHALGDEGPARTLLATVRIANDAIRDTLRAAAAFVTVQGARVSIERAAQPHGAVRIASWHGEWLGADGDPPHAYDDPVIYAAGEPNEVAMIVHKLAGAGGVDVTTEVARLQARRRMARGLLPRPQVRAAAAAHRRTLASFGDVAKRLGHGEIGLVEALESTLLVHDTGALTGTQWLDVLPPIELAVEGDEVHAAGELAQQLAVELVQAILQSVDPTTLSPALQRNLIRAGLAQRIPGVLLSRLPRWRDLAAQRERFGNIWAVDSPTSLRPLDPERIAFFFDRDDIELARECGWPMIDALRELELDDIARKNMARPRAAKLALPTTDGVLAKELLAGDGVTSPRGIVAVLMPSYAHWRGAWPHRAMHPFEHADDPCRWPTLSVVDDARLAPDRTWQHPLPNEAWQAVAKEVRAASERALANIADVPEHALVHWRVDHRACAEVSALRKSPGTTIRGLLWLTGTPLDTVAVQVVDASGMRSFVAPEQLAIGGKLYVFAPDKLDLYFDLDLALRQLCSQTHGKLVRALLKGGSAPADVIAAHVAHALAVRTLRATDVRGFTFSCFSPRPLDARALSSLLRRDGPVVVIRPDTGTNPDPNVVELVDDGSDLARTLIADLGGRIRRARPPAKPRRAREAPVASPPPARAQVKSVQPAKPEPPHPLHGLVAKLRRRLADLGIGGYDWQIVDRAEPMFAYDHGIVVGGDNVRLRALAATVATKSPLADAGVDVVVAHLVTVLNVALSQITDASEAHALAVLLNQQSADRPRSRRSS
jgi:hypothetical protein